MGGKSLTVCGGFTVLIVSQWWDVPELGFQKGELYFMTRGYALAHITQGTDPVAKTFKLYAFSYIWKCRWQTQFRRC